MPTPVAARDVLDREFLELRAKILQIAASLDRVDRGDGSVDGDARMRLIHEGLDILRAPLGDRAEKVQLLFSREYDESWRQTLSL